MHERHKNVFLYESRKKQAAAGVAKEYQVSTEQVEISHVFSQVVEIFEVFSGTQISQLRILLLDKLEASFPKTLTVINAFMRHL